MSTEYKDGCYVEFFVVKDGVRYNANVVNLKDLMMALTTKHINVIETTFEEFATKGGLNK